MSANRYAAEAKRRMLAKWPDAFACRASDPYMPWELRRAEISCAIACGETEDAAWIDCMTMWQFGFESAEAFERSCDAMWAQERQEA